MSGELPGRFAARMILHFPGFGASRFLLPTHGSGPVKVIWQIYCSKSGHHTDVHNPSAAAYWQQFWD